VALRDEFLQVESVAPLLAERLKLSQKTVETYRARLVEKLGIRDVAGLVKFAIQRGLVSLD